MTSKTLGETLLDAVQEAIDDTSRGKTVRPKIDVSEIRKKLQLSQAEFSKRYFIKLETLRGWEQHKREPDTTTLAYLTCIAKQPKQIQKILSKEKFK